MLIVVPSQEVTDEFVDVIKPIFDKWTDNVMQISQLTKQRDELLPLLINGQVSVMPQEVNCDLAA